MLFTKDTMLLKNSACLTLPITRELSRNVPFKTGKHSPANPKLKLVHINKTAKRVYIHGIKIPNVYTL